MKIDLHVHSAYSGGRLSAKEILSAAAAVGVEYLSICDNANIDSLAAASAESKLCGVNVIPGVSVSAWDVPEQMPTRLNAYYFSASDTGFKALLSRLSDTAAENAAIKIRALRKENVNIDEERVAKFISSRFPGRSVNALDPLSVNRFMEYYLGLDRESAAKYIEGVLFAQGASFPPYPEQEEVFGVLKAAGAKIILAHPGYYERRWNKNPGQIELLLERLSAQGLDGVEAYTPANTPYRQELYASVARKLKLLVTTGSNYTGYGRDNECSIGESPCPEWLATELSARFFL